MKVMRFSLVFLLELRVSLLTIPRSNHPAQSMASLGNLLSSFTSSVRKSVQSEDRCAPSSMSRLKAYLLCSAYIV